MTLQVEATRINDYDRDCISDYYNNTDRSSRQTNSAQETNSGNVGFDIQSLSNFLNTIATLQMASGMAGRVFHNPFSMMGSFALFAPFLTNLISDGHANSSPKIEKIVPPTPAINSGGTTAASKTLTDRLAEANNGVADAKDYRRAVIESGKEEAEAFLAKIEKGNKKKKKKTTAIKSEQPRQPANLPGTRESAPETPNLTEEQKAERQAAFSTAIKKAKADLAAANRTVELSGANAATDNEILIAQRALTAARVKLAALGHAKENGLTVEEAKTASSNLLQRVRNIDTALSKINTRPEAARAEQLRFRQRLLKAFPFKKKESPANTDAQIEAKRNAERDEINAYSTVVSNYEEIQNILGDFDSDTLRRIIDKNEQYSLVQQIHAEASQV